MLLIDKVKQIMNDKGLTSSLFADEIGVPRASISHILSGRNKPSIRILMGIIKKFPDIDVNWLMEEENEDHEIIKKPLKRIEGHKNTQSTSQKKTFQTPGPEIDFINQPQEKIKAANEDEIQHEINFPEKKIEKIFIFYSDKTFIEFSPGY